MWLVGDVMCVLLLCGMWIGLFNFVDLDVLLVLL